jgi:hypothetical protein
MNGWMYGIDIARTVESSHRGPRSLSNVWTAGPTSRGTRSLSITTPDARRGAVNGAVAILISVVERARLNSVDICEARSLLLLFAA